MKRLFALVAVLAALVVPTIVQAQVVGFSAQDIVPAFRSTTVNWVSNYNSQLFSSSTAPVNIPVLGGPFTATSRDTSDAISISSAYAKLMWQNRTSTSAADTIPLFRFSFGAGPGGSYSAVGDSLKSVLQFSPDGVTWTNVDSTGSLVGANAWGGSTLSDPYTGDSTNVRFRESDGTASGSVALYTSRPVYVYSWYPAVGLGQTAKGSTATGNYVRFIVRRPRGTVGTSVYGQSNYRYSASFQLYTADPNWFGRP